MTVRAVIFGLLGGMLIAGLGYINDQVLRLASMLAGHLVPVAVLMLILIGGVTLSVLRAFGVHNRIRASEIAVSMTIMMVACSIPVSGLMETFTPSLVMPMHYYKQMPGWKKHKILQYVPPAMLPADARVDDDEAMHKLFDGFLTGKGSSDHTIPLSGVPWKQWERSLTTWMPLVVLAAIAMTCMGLIVHQQWARRERLRYPIAEVATSLLSGHVPGQRSPLYKNRLFWVGFLTIFIIHLANGYYRWNDASIHVPLSFAFSGITEKWPLIRKAEWGPSLTTPQIFFTAIAFSFFLSSDVGLSLGISHLVYVPLAASLVTIGVDMRSDYMAGGLSAWQRFGGCAAFTLILLYVGRNYYWNLIKRALSFTQQEGVSDYEAWAARILLGVLVAMVLILWQLGLGLPMTIMVIAMVMITFVIVARISAETGLFFIQPRWQALGILMGLFGYYALGPEAIVIVGLVCVVLCFDPSQALMPYFVNALWACDTLKVKASRVGWSASASYVIFLVVAVVATLWANYNWGLNQHPFFTDRTPKMTFQAADKVVSHLEPMDKLQGSEQLDPWERITKIDPNPKFLWAVGIGFALVLGFSMMRLRFTWWPLHPVIFLVWGTWPSVRLGQSFFLGWVIKVIVTRLGGNATYQATKPLMIGVIAGDLLGAGIWMLVGGIYYYIFRLNPASYWVFPH